MMDLLVADGVSLKLATLGAQYIFIRVGVEFK